MESIYGRDTLVNNVHCLVHLADDVKRFGSLDIFAAFPFESFLGKLLREWCANPNFPSNKSSSDYRKGKRHSMSSPLSTHALFMLLAPFSPMETMSPLYTSPWHKGHVMFGLSSLIFKSLLSVFKM